MPKVERIINAETGKPAAHFVNQRFKCDLHLNERGMTCVCAAIFCPAHINASDHLDAIMNLIQPGGGAAELTGVIGGQKLASGTMVPFTDEVIQRLFGNTYTLSAETVERFFIVIDPTYSTGTQSSLGVCTMAQLDTKHIVVSLSGGSNWGTQNPRVAYSLPIPWAKPG